VSDARRKTDLQWFREQFGALVKTVRVSASDDIRKQRGWIFTEGNINILQLFFLLQIFLRE
jgi:phosphomevalonate kinase